MQGVVEAAQNAQLFPEMGGRITSIPVKGGDKVRKGQILMMLDSRVVDNQISEIKSRLNLAKIVYEKQKSLWDQEIGSEIQYLEAKNNYESLQRNLETLEAQRSMYVVSRPVARIWETKEENVRELMAELLRHAEEEKVARVSEGAEAILKWCRHDLGVSQTVEVENRQQNAPAVVWEDQGLRGSGILQLGAA